MSEKEQTTQDEQLEPQVEEQDDEPDVEGHVKKTMAPADSTGTKRTTTKRTI